MRKSFKDSVKSLEADLHYANTLAGDYPRECDGAVLQMRLSYSPAARLFLFLVRWADYRLAGALGLLRILIHKAYTDKKTTISFQERKATIREFYSIIFPSLLQLQGGINDVEYREQKEIYIEKYKKKAEVRAEIMKGKSCESDLEREEECGICMELNSSKIVLPSCNHAMCMKCYKDWHARSQSCPFCRDSLKRVNSSDLWIFIDDSEVVDMDFISRENMKRLFIYVDKLPPTATSPVFLYCDSRFI